jgi:UDP:flavonoid glycosyltransferase YjiC (YdhE family)
VERGATVSFRPNAILLRVGVPQLLVNGPGDRRHNSAAIAARGAGLAVDERDIDAAVLTRLVTDEALAVNATEVRSEIDAMPAPEDMAPRLKTLAGRRA